MSDEKKKNIFLGNGLTEGEIFVSLCGGKMSNSHENAFLLHFFDWKSEPGVFYPREKCGVKSDMFKFD